MTSRRDYRPPDFDEVDVSDVDDADDCTHISYTEQAGGWLVCDECGEDVTGEIFTSTRPATDTTEKTEE